jgi:SAM-dependent methyltransferase
VQGKGVSSQAGRLRQRQESGEEAIAYAVQFPRQFNEGLEQTWRKDKLLFGQSEFDYFDVHCSIIDNHEPLKELLRVYLKKNDLVLEAGCGAGRWMSYLLRQGYRSIGVDISSDVLVQIHSLSSDLVTSVGDVLQLPLRANTFDAVLSSYVFEHFPDGPTKPLLECYRVLKPGGILFFIVPFNNFLRRWLFNRLMDVAVRWRKRGRRMDFHEYRFTRRECRRYLREAGFQIVEMKPDDFINGWNKGVAVDYSSLQFYWPELPWLPDDFVLPQWADRITTGLQKLYPWSCCGGITCIARKPAESER